MALQQFWGFEGNFVDLLQVLVSNKFENPSSKTNFACLKLFKNITKMYTLPFKNNFMWRMLEFIRRSRRKWRNSSPHWSTCSAPQGKWKKKGSTPTTSWLLTDRFACLPMLSKQMLTAHSFRWRNLRYLNSKKKIS